MRVVGDRNGNGSFFKAIAAEQAETDIARTVMAFDDGNFNDIVLFIEDEVAFSSRRM